MHLQYAKRMDAVLTFKEMEKRFATNVEESYQLYMFSAWQLLKTAEFAKADQEKRNVKYLPTDEDKAFSPKLIENPLIESIRNCASFHKYAKDKVLTARVDNDKSRLFYNDFAKTDTYKDYISTPSSEEEHRKILLSLYKFCLTNETYDDYLEDNFDNWIHDRSLVVGAMKKTIKSLPKEGDFYKDYIPSDDATLEFGKDLLYKTSHFDQELLDIIKPALKNWEIERVAVIDLVLLKMALCEMLHFPTIPVKVTINEYVDISKLYSTPKSKDFINGILDRLMKKLSTAGKIVKEGRGLID